MDKIKNLRIRPFTMLLVSFMVFAVMPGLVEAIEKNNGLSPGTNDENVTIAIIPPGHPFPVDSRVRAVVDNPSSSSCLMAGDTGVIYCYDPNDPFLPYLVNWDDAPQCTLQQNQVCARLAPYGWWVGFDEIALIGAGAIISPPSGDYCTTQGFDVVIILPATGSSIVGSTAILDGKNVTGAFKKKAIKGHLVLGGLTFRVPDLIWSDFGLGEHTFSVQFTLSSGAAVGDSVLWNVLENTEP